ncbi:MAG: hypothetical protein R2741_15685 [Methanolobus sp.]
MDDDTLLEITNADISVYGDEQLWNLKVLTFLMKVIFCGRHSGKIKHILQPGNGFSK